MPLQNLGRIPSVIDQVEDFIEWHVRVSHHPAPARIASVTGHQVAKDRMALHFRALRSRAQVADKETVPAPCAEYETTTADRAVCYPYRPPMKARLLMPPTYSIRPIDGNWHLVVTQDGKEEVYPAGSEIAAKVMMSMEKERYERKKLALG